MYKLSILGVMVVMVMTTIKNKLQGVRRLITREQAQTPEQISNQHGWATIDNEQAKQLAITLSLAS